MAAQNLPVSPRCVSPRSVVSVSVERLDVPVSGLPIIGGVRRVKEEEEEDGPAVDLKASAYNDESTFGRAAPSDDEPERSTKNVGNNQRRPAPRTKRESGVTGANANCGRASNYRRGSTALTVDNSAADNDDEDARHYSEETGEGEDESQSESEGEGEGEGEEDDDDDEEDEGREDGGESGSDSDTDRDRESDGGESSPEEVVRNSGVSDRAARAERRSSAAAAAATARSSSSAKGEVSGGAAGGGAEAVPRSYGTADFERWRAALLCGYNVALYGIGSKKDAAHEFAEETLLNDVAVLEVHGYKHPQSFPSRILERVCAGVNFVGPNQRPIWGELEEYCEHSFPGQLVLVVLIHNIDDPALAPPECQEAILSLARLKGVRIVVTADCCLVANWWTPKEQEILHFMWYEVHTYTPFSEELSFKTSAEHAQRMGSLSLSGVQATLSQQSATSLAVFRIVLDLVTKTQQTPTTTATAAQTTPPASPPSPNHQVVRVHPVASDKIFSQCRLQHVLHSEAALAHNLKFLVEAQLITMSRGNIYRLKAPEYLNIYRNFLSHATPSPPSQSS
ncbi:origin recognition complex subunit 2 [Pelomyxa schiedti]|nr:origin recognition complex subunit 2 [Pelomyxa schiedti]